MCLYEHLQSTCPIKESIYILSLTSKSKFIRQATMFNRGISSKTEYQSKPLIIYIVTYDW